MNDDNARELFQNLVTVSNSALDRLVGQPVSGVKINTAVLSHELQRKSTLEIALPHFNFQKRSVTTALASVHPQADGGRILLFDGSATSTVSVSNRFISSLSMTVAAAVARTAAGANLPDLRVHSTEGTTWSYELLYAKTGMKREELEAITRPFITQFMAGQFAQGTSLSTFYNQLEDTANKILRNGPETFGDTCASFEVVLPGETRVLGPRGCEPAESSWHTSVDAGQSADQARRLSSPIGGGRAAQRGAVLSGRSGRNDSAIAINRGDTLLSSLLTFESQIVEKANPALQDVQKFLAAAAVGSPSEAVTRLAQFAADIVTAFNQLLGQNVFADLASFRAVSQTVFAEASRAINPGLAGQSKAMLALAVLHAGHTADLAAFLNGTALARGNIAVSQRLVTF